MTQPASRLITLIMLLQHHPNQKAADLAAKLDVSVRTLHRYFAMLDEMGIPVYTERGPHGGFSLVRGYKMPPLIFTPEEAVAIALGTSLVEEMWGSLYREPAAGAMAKLENVLPDEQRAETAWARRSLVSARLHRMDTKSYAPLLEKLRRAVREQRRVEMNYRSSTETEAQSRSLDPYALAFRWGWWYVIGYCHLRNGLRIFRVDRILELALTSQGFSIPGDFDANAYLANAFSEQPGLVVTMRFDPKSAGIALSEPANWETLQKLPDGAVQVTFTTPDLNWAASTVLAYGPAVMVLDPPELRRVVSEWAQEIARQYE